MAKQTQVDGAVGSESGGEGERIFLRHGEMAALIRATEPLGPPLTISFGPGRVVLENPHEDQLKTLAGLRGIELAASPAQAPALSSSERIEVTEGLSYELPVDNGPSEGTATQSDSTNKETGSTKEEV